MGTAYKSAYYFDTKNRLPVRYHDATLGATLNGLFDNHRPYFNDIITFDQTAPDNSLTLREWAQPAVLTTLLATYSDHIYRGRPDLSVAHKPLKSLWAQWYIGLLVPPLMMAALCEPRSLNMKVSVIRAEFHETGRAAHFWIDAREAPQSSSLSGNQRLESVWQNVIVPIVNVLQCSGNINSKLIWSNTGYLVNWFLGELQPLLGNYQIQALRQACFHKRTLSDGSDNPLYRTLIVHEGLLARRTCCQRNRLPNIQQCGDCILNK